MIGCPGVPGNIRFQTNVQFAADHADDGDDALARLETDFILMAQALSDDVTRLLEWLGGETQREPTAQQDT